MLAGWYLSESFLLQQCNLSIQTQGAIDAGQEMVSGYNAVKLRMIKQQNNKGPPNQTNKTCLRWYFWVKWKYRQMETQKESVRVTSDLWLLGTVWIRKKATLKQNASQVLLNRAYRGCDIDPGCPEMSRKLKETKANVDSYGRKNKYKFFFSTEKE